MTLVFRSLGEVFSVVTQYCLSAIIIPARIVKSAFFDYNPVSDRQIKLKQHTFVLYSLTS